MIGIIASLPLSLIQEFTQALEAQSGGLVMIFFEIVILVVVIVVFVIFT